MEKYGKTVPLITVKKTLQLLKNSFNYSHVQVYHSIS